MDTSKARAAVRIAQVMKYSLGVIFLILKIAGEFKRLWLS
jgi:hypothetical protein